MMIMLFGMISFVTGLANPMGVIVKNQFGTSNFMSQLGTLANFIAYAFMGIPAGMMLKKYGYKKTALAAIAVGFVGVGIQFLSGVAASFGVYLVGAFVAGFSMCMLNTVVNPMLNTLGGGGKKGNQLIQVGGTFNSMMATIVPVLVGYLMGDVARATITDANPALFIAMGIFALVFVVFLAVKLPEPHSAQAKEKLSYSSLFRFRHYLFGVIAIFIYVGVEVGIPNIMNLFLTDDATGVLRANPAAAGSIVGTYWFMMLIGRFAGAALGSKISSKTMLSFVSVLGLVFITIAIFVSPARMINVPVFNSDISFGLVEAPINVLFLVLCGLCTSVMWGGIFNLAVEGLGKYVPLASGFFMVMVAGGGVLPAIQGAIADGAGYMASYWVVFIGLVYLLYYALAGCKYVNKGVKVD
jgi:FHS family L-fucose permease-like MFS transporter